MEKFRKLLYYFVYPAALIYTVLSAAFYIASKKTSTDGDTVSFATLMLLLLAYAMILALFTLVFRTKKPPVVKTIIHYLLVLASLALILFVFGKESFSPSSSLLILGGFTAIYAIIAVPALIIYTRAKRRENEQSDYQGILQKKK